MLVASCQFFGTDELETDCLLPWPIHYFFQYRFLKSNLHLTAVVKGAFSQQFANLHMAAICQLSSQLLRFKSLSSRNDN